MICLRCLCNHGSLQNSLLWDERGKRHQRESGCGGSAGPDHEEDGALRGQVVDPRWHSEVKWAQHQREDGRAEGGDERQMQLLRVWKAGRADWAVLACKGSIANTGESWYYTVLQCVTCLPTNGIGSSLLGRWKVGFANMCVHQLHQVNFAHQH